MKWVIQRTNAIIFHLYVESKIQQPKIMNNTKQILTDIENKLMVAKGGRARKRQKHGEAD